MIRNYLKIAWRSLLRNKSFSIINIAGLAIGMASAILILLWMQNEIGYDRFHEKKDRIYEAWNRVKRNDGIKSWNTSPKILAKTLQRDFPEIEQVARVNWENNPLLTVGEKSLNAPEVAVDSGFLKIFSFPMLKGDPNTALNDMHSIVLTEKLAKKIFGNEEALGKVIKLDNKDNFTVTGILKDLPLNTRFNFECLVSWAYLRHTGGDDENWGNNSTRTYVLLKPNTAVASINAKMENLRKKYDKQDPVGGFFLYNVSRWHLYSNFENGKESGGLIELVRLFGIIASFILLIACINFMNLSTARSEKRAKEVGIRKVVGAQKSSIVAQFLGESVLLTFFAGILSLVIVILVLPAFNDLTKRHLTINYTNIWFWLVGIGFILFTGFIAGSYPAFFLSSFRPVKVLKGTISSAQALITPRKVLVIFQFTAAIILIIGTMVIRQQIKYAQNRQSGYNKANLVYHFLTGDLEKNYILVKNELIESGIAESVTKTSAPLTQGWSNSWGYEWPGKDPNDKTIVDRYIADDHIVKTAGLQLIKGRDFDLKTYSTDSTAAIINESAAKLMHLNEPLGRVIKDGDRELHIVGLIKDFILQSPYYPTVPMVIQGAKGWFSIIHVKLNNNRAMAENLKAMGVIFKKYNSQYPFDPRFIDQEYAQKFADTERIGILATLFASLAIFISCLGLFGLAAYMAENRIKEIGVRKVLGASIINITTLLSKDFLILVAISILLAVPVSWYLMYKWLQDFPYHLTISWITFLFAGVLAIVIALLTVSGQAIRAGLSNPIKSLRTE
jgi:putative ABC transport system permease protein